MTSFIVTVAVLCLALATDVQMNLPGPRINLSPSLPLGQYWFTPTHTAKKGEIVVVCFSGAQAAMMRRLSDLGESAQCPSHLEPAAKILAATAGDVVSFAGDGVRINGQLWPMSRPLPGFRPLSQTITLAPGQAVVMGLHPQSVDSRYLGPVDSSAMIGTWHKLLTLEKDQP